MRFMIIVKATPNCEAGIVPDKQVLAEMGRYNEQLTKAGALLAVNRLESSSKGARVHYAKGKFKVTDGPFAETKELVGGFWLIEAKSRDEALDWARRIPFQEGEVEVRPLFEPTDFPVDPAEKPDGWREKEEQFRATPPVRKPGTMRFLGLLKADQETEKGVLPDRDGSVFRGRDEIGRNSLGRRAAAEFAGLSGSVRREKTHSDRWPLCGDQGVDRRLRDHPGQFAGRSDRMDQAIREG